MKQKTSIAALITLTAMLFALIASSFAHAASPLSNEEYGASICIIATEGAYLSSVARVDGLSQSAAAAKLNTEFGKIERHFSHPVFKKDIKKIWDSALVGVYAEPDAVVQSPNFVSEITEAVFLGCLNHFGAPRGGSGEGGG